MKYLGLDLSTVSTGYSIFDENKLIEFGEIIPPDNLAVMERITFISNKIIKIIENHQPNSVIIEDVFYGSNYLTTKILNRLAGSVYYAIHNVQEETGINRKIDFVMPTEARKSFGLLPKSTKKNIVNAVNIKFGLNIPNKNDDEADAIVIGYFGYMKTHTPNQIFKASDKKFYKTKVRGLKTPKLKGTKNAKRKVNKK